MLKYRIVSKKDPQTQATKFYAKTLPPTPVSLEQLCADIADNCTCTVHDVKGVISALQEQIFKALRNGQSVRLGSIGSFRPTLKSLGTDLEKDFLPTNIKKVNCRFTRSTRMRYETGIRHPAMKFVKEMQEPAKGDVIV